MKKLLTILLATSLLLVACGKDKEKEEAKEAKQEVVATEEQQAICGAWHVVFSLAPTVFSTP